MRLGSKNTYIGYLHLECFKIISMKKSIIKSKISTPSIPNLVGNSHRYKTDKGEISLIHPCYTTMDMFEIYCISGDLFEYIERYDSLEDAEKRINELLN